MRPVSLDFRFASAMTSSNVGISKRPLNCCGRSASGWMARKVLISARVKSETNQPSSVAPSTTAVRRRLANSGRVDTSVVAMMFGSWRATR